AFTFDATHCPDLFPALAALAAAAEGVSTIIGTSRLRHKESDRAETIRAEYEKLGIEVDITEENIMKIRGGKIQPATTFSHNDHRIAMSIAVSALRCEGEVTIENAECVAKSYPTFFEDLESIIVR
ncbi:MAG: 3-phosphoshikimate 1-carboxyvinyltransferase, partial [Alistipes sp.]|nr:3-phosphoshikimate 1-carboxyvinyltransferase [Alistipes sp.]